MGPGFRSQKNPAADLHAALPEPLDSPWTIDLCLRKELWKDLQGTTRPENYTSSDQPMPNCAMLWPLGLAAVRYENTPWPFRTQDTRDTTGLQVPAACPTMHGAPWPSTLVWAPAYTSPVLWTCRPVHAHLSTILRASRLHQQPHGSRLLLMLLRPPAATCKPSLASVDHASAHSASTVPRQYDTKRQGKADE